MKLNLVANLGRAASPISILRERNFGLVWSAITLAGMASQMETVVVVWYVLNLTDSPFLVGLTASARMGFNFLALFAGATADIVPRRILLVIVQALTLTIGVAFASTIWSRLPYWRTWAETGVFGYATSAEWIGVAEYFRQNTPKDASVLPLQYGLPSHPRSRDKLMAARYLATRSGRTTPVINELSDMFNLEGWYRELHQQELLRRVAEAFQAGWWDVAAHEVTQLVLVPDYIVLPSAIWDTQRRVSAVQIDVLPYAEETRVRDYVILRRVP